MVLALTMEKAPTEKASEPKPKPSFSEECGEAFSGTAWDGKPNDPSTGPAHKSVHRQHRERESAPNRASTGWNE